MTLSKLKPLTHLICFRSLAVSAAAVRQVNSTLWTPTQLIKISPAAESLFSITVDVSNSPELSASYTKAGQYLQLRLRRPHTRPTFLAIASPPNVANSEGAFEFLVKCIAGSTAELLCKSGEGDMVELSPVMGKGFDIDRISPPEIFQTVLIFATGSGISPIRSLIESGFGADRSDVRLYYGARNLNRMAYQERFKDWESSGINIVPVLSQPRDSWAGYRGFVQAAFAKEKRILNPQSTGAVLCGHKQMAEIVFQATLDGCEKLQDNISNFRVYILENYLEITSVLVADGVSGDKILKNI